MNNYPVFNNTYKPKPELNVELAKMLLGKDGEVRLEDIESNKKTCIGIFADGIYEKRITPVGEFVYKKHNILFPYLDKNGESSFTFSLPKVPFGLLTGVAGFFKDIMDKMNGSEVMVQIYWSFKEERYFIYVPEQEVSGASIRFKHSETLQNNEDVYWVIDIHSHNTMGAFFSGTDSADEKSTRIFGVIGRIKSKDEYDMVIRAGVNGSFTPLKIEDIFDKDDLSEYTVSPFDFDKVTKYKPVASTMYYGYGANRDFRQNSVPQNTHTHNYKKGLAHIHDYTERFPRQNFVNKKSAKQINMERAYEEYNFGLEEDESFYRDFATEYSFNYEDYDTPEDNILFYDLTDEEDTLWGDEIDEDLFSEYRDGCEDLCIIYASKNNGTLDQSELTRSFTSIFENILSIDEFDESSAFATIELMSSIMGKNFDRVIEKYNALYGNL